MPGRPWKTPLPHKARRLAVRYGVTGLLLLTLALIPGGWRLLLLWPALCLLVLTGGYLHAGPSIFRKSEGIGPGAGKRCTDSRIILAPYEAGARLARRIFFKAPPAVEIVPGLWLGGFPQKLPAGTRAVLDLTAEYPRSVAARDVPYASVPMIDLLPPTKEETEQAVAAYRELQAHGSVLVHCALGMTRSAAVTARILVAEKHCESMADALARIRALRPEVTLSADAVAHLEQ